MFFFNRLFCVCSTRHTPQTCSDAHVDQLCVCVFEYFTNAATLPCGMLTPPAGWSIGPGGVELQEVFQSVTLAYLFVLCHSPSLRGDDSPAAPEGLKPEIGGAE